LNRPLHIRGAQVWDSHQVAQRDLYIERGRLVEEPPSGAQVIDLDGYTLFSGLINAHDHLELNHYPRSKFREKYDNAHQWGEDMNARLNDEPYKSLRAYPLEDRCFIGGLKNLLCGATTVVHHNPPHKCLFKSDFPVRVLKEYGWAHSLHFDTNEQIVQSYRATPKEWPWFIHLAEGTDGIAVGEYQRLKDLGCIKSNTVIVHGVNLTSEDCEHAIHHARGLITCPTTNQFLLAKHPTNHDSLYNFTWTWSSLALGSDSRLTADGNLLDEMRFAHENSIDSETLGVPGMWKDSAAYFVVTCVTDIAAFLIGKKDRGDWQAGNLADLLMIRSADKHTWDESEQKLCQSRRSDLALVVLDGIPRIGDPEVMAKFPHIETVGAILDGVPKAIHIDLARRIHRCSLKEPGLEIEPLPKRGFFFS
jgi:cytosine/adenosine deaminase-related metal-dependent hydrolase